MMRSIFFNGYCQECEHLTESDNENFCWDCLENSDLVLPYTPLHFKKKDVTNMNSDEEKMVYFNGYCQRCKHWKNNEEDNFICESCLGNSSIRISCKPLFFEEDL